MCKLVAMQAQQTRMNSAFIYLISLQLYTFTAPVPQALLKEGPCCLQSKVLNYHDGKFCMNILLNCLT